MSDECAHAAAIRDVTPSALGCEECLNIGSPWLHLRLCRTCGNVGCCDDSPNRHATLSRAPRGQLALAHEQAITALWLLSGKTVAVRQDGPYGNTVLDYHETLPEGLAPMVVLDASGRVREI